MTKFEELCQSFGYARNSWFEYRDKCQSFGARVVSGFLKFLEIPDSAQMRAASPENVKTTPNLPESLWTWAKLDADGRPIPAGRFDAIRLEEDGFWHARFLLTVYEQPNVFPYQPLLLEFAFKPSGADFRVRLSQDESEIMVSEAKQDTFEALNNALLSRIQNYFKDSTDWERDSVPKPRKIGFTSGKQ